MKVGHSKAYGAVKSDNNHCCLSRKWSKKERKLSHGRVRKAGKKEIKDANQDR